MPEYIKIDATKRTVVGKQVKQLRREGMVPAIVYGPEREPLSLTLDKRELRQTLLTAGGTQIIEIVVDGETIPTLAREVQLAAETLKSVGQVRLRLEGEPARLPAPVAEVLPLRHLAGHLVGEEPDVLGAIVAPTAAALDRLHLDEAGLPEPQHVRRNVQRLGDLAYGAEGFGRLVHRAAAPGPTACFHRPRALS